VSLAAKENLILEFMLPLIAIAWGCAWGAVTSIPLGPTGALVLSRASRNDRRGIYLATAGFALAHLIYQGLYHAGLAPYLQGNATWLGALAAPGLILLIGGGLLHLRRGWTARKMGSLPQITNHPLTSGPSSIVPKRPRLGVLAQSFTMALFNPVLLIFLAANAALFSATFPGQVGPLDLVLLLAATLFGTVFWYIAFGEWLRRRASAWGPKEHSRAELVSGVLMITAGFALARQVF
jgi:threonine/homoserine/homoserine lactone efflux protein